MSRWPPAGRHQDLLGSIVVFTTLLIFSVKMSTAMNFGTKSFTPRAPDKGAFPLDHLGECKTFKEIYMKCLTDNKYDNSLCREQSKDYLQCRMERQLMAKEPLEKLGFKDLMDTTNQTKY